MPSNATEAWGALYMRVFFNCFLCVYKYQYVCMCVLKKRFHAVCKYLNLYMCILNDLNVFNYMHISLYVYLCV